MTVERSNPPFMHFSRKPPGPNTSRIEGLPAAALPSVDPALSGACSRSLKPSSSGTYTRSSGFALRLAAVIGVTFEFAVFFGRVHLQVKALGTETDTIT